MPFYYQNKHRNPVTVFRQVGMTEGGNPMMHTGASFIVNATSPISFLGELADDAQALAMAGTGAVLAPSTTLVGSGKKERNKRQYVIQPIVNVFLTNQVEWLTEVGAVQNTDIWETFPETMLRKGYFTLEEAATYRKGDSLFRQWKEARRKNTLRGNRVITGHKGSRLATEEEYLAHISPKEIAA